MTLKGFLLKGAELAANLPIIKSVAETLTDEAALRVRRTNLTKAMFIDALHNKDAKTIGMLAKQLSTDTRLRSEIADIASQYGIDIYTSEEALANAMSGFSKERMTNLAKDYATYMGRAYKDYLKTAYFGEHLAGKQRAKRIASTVATYGLGAVGLRYLSGGSLMYNNMGERDIAGIPFI